MKRFAILFTVLCFIFSATTVIAEDLKSPEQFFGFTMGSEGKLARWDKVVEYFNLLGSTSDRIEVIELGKSTEGNPFLLAVISSPENLAAKARYMEINRKLSDPRGLSKKDIATLVKDGKYTLAMTLSLHATEVGGTQSAPDLAYELITDESDYGKMIRENCIFLLFPCFNPDGQIMVTDWQAKTRGTEYEGARLPYLYHKYTGHDNNRDGYMITQAESKLVSKVLYKEWFPQAYIDQHHMGSYGARFYIPPYFDPIHPNVDPLIWREHLLYGAHMAMRLEQADVTGVETGAPYTAWWFPSFHMVTNYHNITGMLTESASADIAHKIFVHPHQLQPGRRGRPEYKPTVNFPHPWPGGWWSLVEIVKQMKIAAYSALELGALNREMLLSSMADKAMRNVERGTLEAPYAYLIPENQHDPFTALKMLDTLMTAGVEVQRSTEEIRLGSAVYPAGTYVLRLDQPLRVYIKSLMERINFPDNEWTRQRDGRPIRPYDMAIYNLPEFMGVKIVSAKKPLTTAMSVIDAPAYPEGKVVGDGANGYLFCHRFNDSFIAVNRIMAAGGTVWWLKESVSVGEMKTPLGAMLVKADKPLLEKIASELHLTFMSAPAVSGVDAIELSKLRFGMYQRYQGGNMDEGWTRWLLEQFEFPYISVKSDEIKKGNLNQKYDVILLPDDRLDSLLGPDYEKPKPADSPVPPEYRSGLAEEGVTALKQFVEAGGTLIALNGATALPIDKFELPVVNVVDGLDSADYYCPGSTLKMNFNTEHPIAYGMPETGLGLNWRSPAFAIRPHRQNINYAVVASYPDSNPLQSGWLIGDKYLYQKASVVEAKLGKGKVVLFGMRPQLRAQLHGTFKLMFNALYYAGAKEVKLQ